MLHTRFTSQGKRKPARFRPQPIAAAVTALVLSGGFLFALLRYMVVWDARAAERPVSSLTVETPAPPTQAPTPSPTLSPTALIDSPASPTLSPTPTPSPTPEPAPVLLEDAENGLWSYTCKDFNLTIERVHPEEHVTATLAVLSDYKPGTVTSAFAEGQYGRNLRSRTSDIARDAGVLFAINGDYCGYRNDGIVVRGGVVYREKPVREMMAIYADGRMELVTETEADLEKMLADGLQDTYSFGPVLVRDGVVPETISTDVPGNNPRTAVGQKADGSFVFLVVDGRQSSSQGMNIHALADYLLSLGCVNAYNLDGGMTSCMVFNGQVISSPCGNAGRERAVSDILCIYPLAEPEVSPEEAPGDDAASGGTASEVSNEETQAAEGNG